MRNIIKKVFSIIVVLLISGAVFFGYNYVAKNLKSHLTSFLEQNFNAKFSIDRVGIYLPLCLELKDVEIDDSVDIRCIRIYPKLVPFLLKNNFIVSTVKIIEPVVRLKKTKDRQFVIPDFLKKKENSSNAPMPNLYFSGIRIHNGTLIYDAGNGNTLEFVGIKGRIKNPGVYFSKDDALQFAAAGFLKNKDSDFLSPLIIDGVIGGRSMINTRLQIMDIKVDTFGFIYGKYLSNFIKEGRVDLKSDIRISKRHLIAKCFLEGEDVVLKKGQDQKLDTPIAASFILFVNFKNNLVKIKNLRGNFFKIVLDR